MTPEVRDRIEQLRRGNIPKGYKRSKSAIVPEEWLRYKISDFATVGQGFTFKREFQGIRNGNWNYFKVADIGLDTNGKYLTTALNTINDETMHQIGCVPFKRGSIVFPRVGAALLNNKKKLLAQDSIVDDNVLVLSVVDADVCFNEFIYYSLHSIKLEDWCNAGLVPVINSETVYKHVIYLPSVQEQEKIAKILTTQDKVIELKEKLLIEKQRQKKYLMQQLLTGKKRLPGFDGEWRTVKLNEVLLERKEKNSKQDHRICSVAVQKGVVDQVEHLGRSYAAADTSNYGVAHYGDIIYTKSPTGDFPYGIIKQSQMNEDVALSPLYGVYEPVCYELGYILHTYFGYAINCSNYLLPIIQKGAKNTINITNDVFVSNKLLLPVENKEQKALAEIFITADKEIDLLRKELGQEKQKKRALMQLLLTGIVRV